ncbi:MAG TPA: protein-S-isoprenylcysteine O-methyltransferase [Anaerolineaceae bacterium]|jgi:protein-S-isoprenylcysteine O-methyltransferase Ste14|nr:protein-S-isoprenylcysteine O-methyltransferase [Anaerolineaceae bacterium]
MNLFKIVFWAGTLMQIVIRAPFAIKARPRKKVERHVSVTENVLLVLLTIAAGILPLIYSVTHWLVPFNYYLPVWMGWLGIVILILSLLIFWRAHADLQANWSPSLELYEEHTLITNGIYRYIRHPMYASQLVWGIAQALLIQNWIAGFGSLIFFVPFYILRSRAEEQMMLAKFGDQYREYKKSTGGIAPKFQ